MFGNLLKLSNVRKKVLFTLFAIVIFRFLAHVPVPGVNVSALKYFVQNNQLLGFFDLFSGGALQNSSIVILGLGPYINASIIIQLLTTFIPKFEELSKEGEYGREVLNQYTRYLTVPISFIQSYGVYFLLSQQGLLNSYNTLDIVTLMFTLTAGGLFLVWLGDLVTQYGLGNGVSVLIFVGIVSRLPSLALSVYANYYSYDFLTLAIFAILSFFIIYSVVLINEGQRNIPLEYGRRGLASTKVTNYLPIKVNQAGVIPIIFAVSLIQLPVLLASYLSASSTPLLQGVGNFLTIYFSPVTLGYNLIYFVLVVAFTFFYTSFQFNPEKISEDVKKRGGFIPGIRPGLATKGYIQGIVMRLTLSGAIFLGIIAIMPYITSKALGVSELTLGGTSLLIVVSVVLETIRQLESLSVSKSYEGYHK